MIKLFFFDRGKDWFLTERLVFDLLFLQIFLIWVWKFMFLSNVIPRISTSLLFFISKLLKSLKLSLIKSLPGDRNCIRWEDCKFYYPSQFHPQDFLEQDLFQAWSASFLWYWEFFTAFLFSWVILCDRWLL